MLEKVTDACAFALETRLWDMVPGGDVLDDLQLLDWSAGDILSSSDSSTGDGGIPGANRHLPEWGCKSPLPIYSSAQYPSCPSPLLSFRTSDAIDKAGFNRVWREGLCCTHDQMCVDLQCRL